MFLNFSVGVGGVNDPLDILIIAIGFEMEYLFPTWGRVSCFDRGVSREQKKNDYNEPR
jgi:hypothetical protein